MHTADYVLTYDSPELARVVEQSVGVEMGAISGDRTRARVDRDGSTVTVTVTADDLVALRAGTTTWLTLVEVAEAAAGIPTASRS